MYILFLKEVKQIIIEKKYFFNKKMWILVNNTKFSVTNFFKI